MKINIVSRNNMLNYEAPKFKEFIFEGGKGGAKAGKLEIRKTSLEKARAYAEKRMEAYDRYLDTEIPQFDKNYLFAQGQAGLGHTKRKDMPVITFKDVRGFQTRLRKGHLDIGEPFAPTTDEHNPFPEGLTGAEAKMFLQAGLAKHDGDKDDDKVKVHMEKVLISELKPIQEQIYFDKSIEQIAKAGEAESEAYLTSKNTVFIVSIDNFIIDGHHRYLSGMLDNPEMKVNCLVIDLPISTLLPLSLAYGDAVGNKRNA